MQNKTIILGISGGIAAYKSVDLVSQLVKLGARVHVCMTKNAENFVSPLSLEIMSGNKVHRKQEQGMDIEHIKLAELADLILLAPATANSIAKLASGISDEIIYDVILASKAPIVIAPAMNTNMWEHPSTVKNLEIISKNYNYNIIDPELGLLACKHEGQGRLASNETIIAKINSILYPQKNQHKIIITGGPTREAIDPVRFISNRSSGKMAFALARAAIEAGLETVLISTIKPSEALNCKIILVENSQEMLSTLETEFVDAQSLVMAAAVSDYIAENFSEDKLSKQRNLALKLNIDILETLAKVKKNDQQIIGFSVETKDSLKKAQAKLQRKKMNAIIVNDPSAFDSSHASVKILDSKNQIETFDQIEKTILAKKIIDKILTKAFI